MSNYPPPGMPPTAYPQPGYPPEQRSGCGCGGCLGKFFIILGILFFLVLVVCCGGTYYSFQTFKNATTQRPAEVQAITDEIASMDVPAPLQPVGGGRYKVPFVNTPLGQGAMYAAPDGKAVLVVASFSDAFGPQFKDQLMQNLESGQNQQKPANNKDDLHEELKDVKKSTIERTIRGEPATFDISEGVGVHSGKKKIQAQGAFQGKTGPAILFIAAETDTLSHEKVDDVIKSIDGGEEKK